MSVNKKMTAIADRLRGYSQKTDKLSLDKMASVPDEVFMQGFAFGKVYSTMMDREDFWDVYQANGTRTNYAGAFAGLVFGSGFNPKYPMNVTNAKEMFAGAQVEDLSGVGMDFSQCVNFEFAFYNVAQLVELGDISTVSAESLSSTFNGSRLLAEIGDLTVREETEFANTFRNCNALTTINFCGIIGQNLNMKWSPLNRASIESILGCLSGVAKEKTLTLKSAQVDVAYETAEGASDGREIFEDIILDIPNWSFSY